MVTMRTVLFAVAAASLEYAAGFYIPGVAPVEYKDNDPVRVMVSLQMTASSLVGVAAGLRGAQPRSTAHMALG